jgi:hypothetical protein
VNKLRKRLKERPRSRSTSQELVATTTPKRYHKSTKDGDKLKSKSKKSRGISKSSRKRPKTSLTSVTAWKGISSTLWLRIKIPKPSSRPKL